MMSFSSLSRLIMILVVFISMPHSSSAQSAFRKDIPDRPKLVVGIVVDQMRYDYLYRYAANYSDKGFKRLLREGYSCENTHYDYVPTYTAPGHACIYTGTTPSVNGIISNEWYDRNSGKSVYCVNDTSVDAVGTTSISGKMSPLRLQSTTVTDELRFATNYRSKVISIALKDRGAILPGGFTANAAYWHDPYLNNWVTSTYYMKELPEWVTRFNQRKMVDSLTSMVWNLALPAASYTGSTADDVPYEGAFKGETAPVFPHDLPKIKATDSELIRRTPMGNTYTLEFVKAAMAGEKLGKGPDTDFLAFSLSSTDYVGHQFGINSMEIEDTYIRLDRELGDFIDYLDKTVGRNNYTLFLTADHGACANPEFNADHKTPSGNADESLLRDSLRLFLQQEFGDSALLLSADAYNIFLNQSLIKKKRMDISVVENACARWVVGFEGVAGAWTATDLSRSITREGVAQWVQRGFHPERSADVSIQLRSGWIDWYRKTGTSHGSAYGYDTHVPLVFFGSGISPGRDFKSVSVCDIAPTISSFLEIQEPSGTLGRPIQGLLSK